jgi:amino acid transporter
MSAATRFWRALAGRPRDLRDSRLFHRLALIPFLAWVGLGADGLSSSSYGPEEAFRALGEHRFLAIALAAATALTVLLISAAYRRIIEVFPSGGGGYVVASRLLGDRAGLVSGAALLVDYVLTVTISLAAAGDALFSFLPVAWHGGKLLVEVGLLMALTMLNLRGVRESVLTLLPVFVLFLVTHAILIGAGILLHVGQLPATASAVTGDLREGIESVGILGLLLIFLRAYAMGGGTYTGIEAVSNGLPIMREPRAETGKRTMIYMGISLAVTASGLLLCYLLWDVRPVVGKTMNAVLVDRIASGVMGGGIFVVLTLFAEAALLVVAAQAGFLDGPRVLANMAVDSWVPHRFAALSDRLTARNGIFLICLAALAALLYTGGSVGHLVVMYSINVFLTFTLSMLSMLRYWRTERARPEANSRLALFGAGFLLCLTILLVTVFEKFAEGGWVTMVITVSLVGVCLLIRRHYRAAAATVDRLYRELGDLPVQEGVAPVPPDPRQPVALVLVEGFGGVGIHTMLNVFRAFPGHFKGIVFLSVGVVDSGEFKGADAVGQLEQRTTETLERYTRLSAAQGVPAAYRYAIGTEVVAEAERLCLQASQEFPCSTVFTGRLVFKRERWWHALLHNRTALAIQKRLQWAGRTMVMLPIRVRE